MGFIDQVSHPYDGQSGCQTIEDRGKKIDADRPFGPNPSPSLSPVDSALLGREPAAESTTRYGGRVIGIPTAALAADGVSVGSAAGESAFLIANS